MESVQQIQSRLEAAFPGDTVRLESGDGRHFTLLVVSPRFDGLTPIARHRLVHQAVGDGLETAIHALSITALTPEQWAKRSNS